MALGPGSASRGGGRRRVLSSHADQADFYRLPDPRCRSAVVSRKVCLVPARHELFYALGVLCVERRVRDYTRISSTGSSRPGSAAQLTRAPPTANCERRYPSGAGCEKVSTRSSCRSTRHTSGMPDRA